VIGLSHVWHAHMVYVHWVQRPVNQHQIAYKDDDLAATIEDALSKILLVLVVVVPYVWFTTSMTFCVLSTLKKSYLH
jgi:hypothetical protein